MAKTPNITTAPTGQIAPFGLRMLPELREKIEETAKAAGRSMNAEIVTRLESSFSAEQAEVPSGLSEIVLWTLKDAAEGWNLPLDQALERAVLAGVSPNAPEVLLIRPSGAMTRQQFSELFDVARERTHPDTAVHMHAGPISISAKAEPALQVKGSPQPVQPGIVEIRPETIKAVVRGKKVDTGIVSSRPRAEPKKR